MLVLNEHRKSKLVSPDYVCILRRCLGTTSVRYDQSMCVLFAIVPVGLQSRLKNRDANDWTRNLFEVSKTMLRTLNRTYIY